MTFAGRAVRAYSTPGIRQFGSGSASESLCRSVTERCRRGRLGSRSWATEKSGVAVATCSSSAGFKASARSRSVDSAMGARVASAGAGMVF